MRRWLAIGAAVLGAVALAAVITLIIDGGESVRLAMPAATSPADAPARASQTAANLPAPLPMPMQPRPPAPPVPIVTSPLPPDDPAAAGPMPRIVGQPGISPGPVVRGRMEREAPPPKPPSVPEGPQWRPFTQVVVIGAGQINLGGRKVALAGITVPEIGTVCSAGPDTKGIDCALMSMQALRQRIRARGIECQLDTLEHLGAEPVTCRIGITDLGLWLVEQGWAGAAAVAPDDYRTAEQAARCAGAGIWAAAPRPDGCPAR